MTRRLLWLGLVGLLALTGVLAAVAGGSAAPRPAWGTAVEVPGTAALNVGGNAGVNAISCPTAGNCAAGGSYTVGSGNPRDSSTQWRAFVADETDGSWDKAIEIPGVANSGRGASVDSVSCSTPGNCVAAGMYYHAGSQHVFVVDETNGSWGDAIEIPGTTTLYIPNSINSTIGVTSVSCATVGNCVVGGWYSDVAGNLQAFVVDETDGRWGDAIEVPGTATLNSGGYARVSSVSCPTAGNCVAGGHYVDGSDHYQAFVAEETEGRWGNAIEVPGTAALNGGGSAEVSSVSCTTPGNCVAGGYYTDASHHGQAFVVDETNGSWGDAIEIPGLATLNTGGGASVSSVSCSAVGNCVAGGAYSDGSGDLTCDCAGNSQAFVVDETNGDWGTAIEVPGTATLNNPGDYGDAGVDSVSCAAAGNCVAGGHYYDGGSAGPQGFVVSETSGSWGNAIEVPGTANIGDDVGYVTVSCATADSCVAGGSYDPLGHEDASGHFSGSGAYQAFVVSYAP